MSPFCGTSSVCSSVCVILEEKLFDVVTFEKMKICFQNNKKKMKFVKNLIFPSFIHFVLIKLLSLSFCECIWIRCSRCLMTFPEYIRVSHTVVSAYAYSFARVRASDAMSYSSANGLTAVQMSEFGVYKMRLSECSLIKR